MNLLLQHSIEHGFFKYFIKKTLLVSGTKFQQHFKEISSNLYQANIANIFNIITFDDFKLPICMYLIGMTAAIIVFLLEYFRFLINSNNLMQK